MRQKKLQTLTLPEKLQVEFLKGEPFMHLRQAAKLARVHPAVLEMAQRLLKAPELEAGVFHLASETLRGRADEIEATFVAGLRRVARVFAAGSRLAIKSHRNGDRLVFWYAVRGPGIRKATK